MNKLIGLMTWDSKRRFSEAFMDTVSTSPPPSNKKVSCLSFRDTIPLLRHNPEPVKLVPSPLPLCRSLMLHPPTPKL